jgi:hypothetical protein
MVSKTPQLTSKTPVAASPVNDAKIKGGQMPDVVQTPRLNVRNAYAATPLNKDGQMLDAAQIPKPHVRNESVATPVDNVTHLQEKVNTPNQNDNKEEAL